MFHPLSLLIIQHESKQNQDSALGYPPSYLSTLYSTLPPVLSQSSYQMSLLLLIANRWVMQTFTHTIPACLTPPVTCDLSQPSLEGLVTGCVSIAPNCPGKVDTLSLQTQNSPDFTPKFRSLLSTDANKCTATWSQWHCPCSANRITSHWHGACAARACVTGCLFPFPFCVLCILRIKLHIRKQILKVVEKLE